MAPIVPVVEGILWAPGSTIEAGVPLAIPRDGAIDSVLNQQRECMGQKPDCSQRSKSTDRASVLPVPNGISRPLWSVMIPTHNCANYLRETLASVLEQFPGVGHMQIEVVDDCSTKDDPEAVVRELGMGHVTFHRQPTNVGHTRNFETCLHHSRGHLIHLLHGDDAVRPGFYAKMEQTFVAHSDIGAAFSRSVFIDEQGRWVSISPLEAPRSGILEDLVERM